jgi:hypothetical protein
MARGDALELYHPFVSGRKNNHGRVCHRPSLSIRLNTGIVSRTAEVIQLKSHSNLRRMFRIIEGILLVNLLTLAVVARQGVIDSRNLAVLGFTLGGNEVSDVEQRLGKARVSSAWDHGMTQRCYESKSSDRTVLAIEDWTGTLSGFRIYRADKSDPSCTKTALITPEISTASGLKLGLSKDQAIGILGKPTKSVGDILIYISEFKQPPTAEDIARFKQAYPGKDFSDLLFFVRTEIKLSFKDSKISKIEVSHTETT